MQASALSSARGETSRDRMHARLHGRSAKPARPHDAHEIRRPAHTTGPARATHEQRTAGRRHARCPDGRREEAPGAARLSQRRRPDAPAPPATRATLRPPEPEPPDTRAQRPPLKNLEQQFLFCSFPQVTIWTGSAERRRPRRRNPLEDLAATRASPLRKPNLRIWRSESPEPIHTVDAGSFTFAATLRDARANGPRTRLRRSGDG